jgi:hypothetical protein
MSSWLSFFSSIVPFLTALIGLLAVIIFLGRGTIQFGSFRFDFEKATAERVRQQINEDIAKGASPQNALMREYHAQGLSQSRVSFWFSLTFASLGFAIIALSVGIFLQRLDNPSAGWLDTAGKPIFTLIAGTVIDAVSALFFVQSNKARQLMTEFFDKLRVDRKLDEALRLMSEIPDPVIASRLKGIVALTFAEVQTDNAVLTAMLSKPDKSELVPEPEEAKPSSIEKPRVVDALKTPA